MHKFDLGSWFLSFLFSPCKVLNSERVTGDLMEDIHKLGSRNLQLNVVSICVIIMFHNLTP